MDRRGFLGRLLRAVVSAPMLAVVAAGAMRRCTLADEWRGQRVLDGDVPHGMIYFFGSGRVYSLPEGRQVRFDKGHSVGHRLGGRE